MGLKILPLEGLCIHITHCIHIDPHAVGLDFLLELLVFTHMCPHSVGLAC